MAILEGVAPLTKEQPLLQYPPFCTEQFHDPSRNRFSGLRSLLLGRRSFSKSPSASITLREREHADPSEPRRTSKSPSAKWWFRDCQQESRDEFGSPHVLYVLSVQKRSCRIT